MNKQGFSVNLPKEPEYQERLEMKAYHAPLLTEWGNLPGLTKGGQGNLFDSHGINASNIHAKFIPTNTVNPIFDPGNVPTPPPPSSNGQP